jgi:hypothetical protein
MPFIGITTPPSRQRRTSRQAPPLLRQLPRRAPLPSGGRRVMSIPALRFSAGESVFLASRLAGPLAGHRRRKMRLKPKAPSETVQVCSICGGEVGFQVPLYSGRPM